MLGDVDNELDFLKKLHVPVFSGDGDLVESLIFWLATHHYSTLPSHLLSGRRERRRHDDNGVLYMLGLLALAESARG